MRTGPPCSRGRGCALPRVHQQDVVFHGAGQRQVRGVRDAGAWHLVVAGAQHVARIVVGHDQLGQRPETHSAPVVVEAAPRRHAVEVADVVDLWQREKLRSTRASPGCGPARRSRAATGRAAPPDIAQVEHRPVAHLVLADGQSAACRRGWPRRSRLGDSPSKTTLTASLWSAFWRSM